MLTKTNAELVDAVLENLGVLAEGQTSEPEQTSRIQGRLPSILATLRSTEVFYLGNADAIPEDAFNALSDVVAYACHNSFGVTGEELQALKIADTEARVALKTIQRGRPTYQPLQTEYL